MKCQLCHREAELEKGYCQYHMKAYSNLISAYTNWKTAYGELPWEAYLRRIIALSEAGTWVKEVAEAELGRMS